MAMEAVVAHERGLGIRTARCIVERIEGTISRAGIQKTGRLRFIEVKGRRMPMRKCHHADAQRDA